jgi:prevent-host-death family protein
VVVLSYSEARNNLKRLCDNVRRSRRPARIHRRGGDVVVLAAEDWEAIEESLYVASIPGAVKRIKRADDFAPLPRLTRKALARLLRK